VPEYAPGKINPFEIENVLNKMFSPEWLRDTATKVGYVQRNRKIDPVTFFWVVVLGFGVGVQRTLASLRRAYETASAETLVPSSFYDRFNKNLIAFLKECLAHGIAELTSHTSLTLSDKLAGFKDLIVADELGYVAMDETASDHIFQFIARAYEKRSVIVTSNLDFAEWGTLFANTSTATATLDRLLHHAHVFNMKGDSYRMRSRLVQSNIE
jgi:hypothetical protein